MLVFTTMLIFTTMLVFTIMLVFPVMLVFAATLGFTVGLIIFVFKDWAQKIGTRHFSNAKMDIYMFLVDVFLEILQNLKPRSRKLTVTVNMLKNI